MILFSDLSEQKTNVRQHKIISLQKITIPVLRIVKQSIAFKKNHLPDSQLALFMSRLLIRVQICRSLSIEQREQ